MRLFFAAWPDEAAKEDLIELRDAAECPGGRPVPAGKLHMTLLFAGDVASQAIQALDEAAADIACPPCEVRLDHFWPGNKKHKRLIMGAHATPPALAELHSRLVVLAGLHTGKPLRSTGFRPHVTLWRKVTEIRHLPSAPEVRFRISGFSLVRSTLEPDGSRYEVLSRYRTPQQAPSPVMN